MENEFLKFLFSLPSPFKVMQLIMILFPSPPLYKNQLTSCSFCFFLQEFWPECLPSITEEREEQSREENIPLSPSGLGTNAKTQIVDDR